MQTNTPIQSSLPKPWENDESFHDALYDWIQRAPWLALSLAAHGIVFFIIQAIPWNLFEDVPETIIVASIETPPETPFEDPPEPEPEIIEQEEEIEPEIQDVDVVTESVEADSDEDFLSSEGDPDQLANSPLDSMQSNSVIGIGGGAGGKYGNRLGGKRNGGPLGGSGTAEPLRLGLAWLADHQSEDGSWSAAGFMHAGHAGQCDCEDGGNASQDVGLTGLCLLAFLGDSNTTREGLYRDTVVRGVKWLRSQQDYETGLIGEDIGHSFVYDHSIAALALAEAYYFSKSPNLRTTVKRAVRYIEKARDPYGAWRYDVPSIGNSDTSVTGWMVLALKSAEEGRLPVDQGAYDGALAWIDEATDPGNGRVGYEQAGSSSSRVTGVNDHFPTDNGEAMTAVGLLSRFFLGQDPSEHPVMEQHADLMLKALPEWDPEGLGCDMYYWYYGTYAMFQMGGKHWTKWNKAMKSAVVDSQSQAGHERGSWDPIGPWGHAGGRVYSTALMVLCLEVYYRYSRVLGAR